MHLFMSAAVPDSYDGQLDDYDAAYKSSQHLADLDSTIDNLPVELLIHIFVYSTHDSAGSAVLPLTISQVCHFWREIVFNTPYVWQQLWLDDSKRSLRASSIQVELWLRYSQSLPIDIHVNLVNADNLLPLLSPLLPHLFRWNRCYLTGKVQEEIDFASFSEDGSQPVLDNLQITVKGPIDILDPTQGMTVPPKIFRSTPASVLGFNMSRIHRVTMCTEVYTIPVPPLMSAVYMQRLVIRENSIDVTSDPPRLINFLLCCPELRVFNYHALPNEPSPETERVQLPIAYLPHLRVLVLRSTCAVRAILSHIDAPALQELYLEHTNMDFQLHHSAAYSTAIEEGESDDEAHDFSQSPWSDHSTGMGLRSLIRRSNPPLEVLEMDYADMRTKDFLWCFDRLNLLQEFRIVASDMSDKVVGMLAPIWGDENGDKARVRMPKLSVMELWNCQRLGGDAVVAALTERVGYTDRVQDRNEYARFTNVVIAGCMNFLPQHRQALAPVLGSRLIVHG